MHIKAKIQTGDVPLELNLKGRLAWTLLELQKAGQGGISSLQNPAPRISHYVLVLRRKGVQIETIRQAHKGPFPGIHGVYRLSSEVSIEPVGACA